MAVDPGRRDFFKRPSLAVSNDAEKPFSVSTRQYRHAKTSDAARVARRQKVHGARVALIDEFRTSKVCSYCGSLLEKTYKSLKAAAKSQAQKTEAAERKWIAASEPSARSRAPVRAPRRAPPAPDDARIWSAPYGRAEARCFDVASARSRPAGRSSGTAT